MGKFIREGQVIDVVLDADVVAGEVVVINDQLPAVAKSPASEGDLVSLTIEGVFEFDTEVEISQGERVYWDADDEVVTVSEDDLPLGVAMTDDVSGKVHVKINC
jgi:predicted RecA/RadA family phage recombinase